MKKNALSFVCIHSFLFKNKMLFKVSVSELTKLLISVLIYAYESVPMTISYHVYFLRGSKVQNVLHHGSVGCVQTKQFYFGFIDFFGCFSSEICFCFFSVLSFLFFFFFDAEVLNSHNRILTNQIPELAINYMLQYLSKREYVVTVIPSKLSRH